jgi:hypothetical protein
MARVVVAMAGMAGVMAWEEVDMARAALAAAARAMAAAARAQAAEEGVVVDLDSGEAELEQVGTVVAEKHTTDRVPYRPSLRRHRACRRFAPCFAIDN